MPLCAVMPSYLPLFLAYGASLKILGSNDMQAVAIAGAASGVCYSLVICPFEMVKCNTQITHKPPGEMFRQVLAQRGALGLYRGLSVCFCRDIGQGIAYYTSAEYFNRSTWMQQSFGGGTAFVAGMLTGLIHCSVEFPFDTIKTRFQTGNAPSYRALLRDMFQAGVASGLRSVFKGYGVWILRAPIVHGTSFASIQFMHPTLNKWF